MSTSIAFCLFVVFCYTTSTVNSFFFGKLANLGYSGNLGNGANNGGSAGGGAGCGAGGGDGGAGGAGGAVSVINATCIENATRNCSSTTAVCGRQSGSNVCMRFTSDCELKYTNCGLRCAYREVNTTLCTRFPLNVRRRCYGGSGNNNRNGIMSNLLADLGLDF